jgi:cytidine deaminase
MSAPDPRRALAPNERPLVDAARKVREAAICPHSGFAVGAALESADGRIWTGANVENASFNLGLCAERVALFHALTHGGSDFRHVVVVTDTPTPTSPCGACRQILFEFARDATVIMVGRDEVVLRARVSDLVPHAFDERALDR